MRPTDTTRAAPALLSSATAHAQSQPYAAFGDRPIKALSADLVAGLRAGRGMAMALPAELNRYPGPLHVLEHAAALDLTAEQKDQLLLQIDTMRTAAVALGEQIIARESELDAHFRSGAADAETIDRITSAIAALKYQTLRGYEANSANPVHKH
jgi:hypothetical protein